jgi:hypothetical protein
MVPSLLDTYEQLLLAVFCLSPRAAIGQKLTVATGRNRPKAALHGKQLIANSVEMGSKCPIVDRVRSGRFVNVFGGSGIKDDAAP